MCSLGEEAVSTLEMADVGLQVEDGAQFEEGLTVFGEHAVDGGGQKGARTEPRGRKWSTIGVRAGEVRFGLNAGEHAGEAALAACVVVRLLA